MLELVVSLVVTAGLAPVVRAQMLRHEFLDVPNHRSSHTVPTPRAGGIACLGGVLAAAALGQIAGHQPSWWSIGAVALLAGVGFADDRRGVPPLARLGAQVAVGAGAGFALGGIWGSAVGLFLTPAVVNAVNFMDGINGITGLTMASWGFTALVVGLASNVSALSALGAASAGAALGFLPFNAPRARMFLGDVGSYLFGALVGCGLMLGWIEGAPVAVLAAPLFVYATDTFTALLRRARRGERLTDPHREHIYQQLTAGAGLPHLVVAVYVGVLGAVLTLVWGTTPRGVAGLITVLTCTLYLLSPRLVRHLSGRITAGAR